MKRNIFKIFVPILAALVLSACVDDYTDSNPPSRLDAPTLKVSSSGNNQAVVTTATNAFQNTQSAYVIYNTPATFTVSVIDAPGKIGAITVTSSVPDFGTVQVNQSSVDALIGKESGDFTFTYTPNPDLTDDEERALNIVVTVSDVQKDEKGNSAPKVTTLTLPTSLVKGPCLTSGITTGFWKLTSASGNIDGGDTYTLDTLKKYAEVNNIFVEINQERPGVYSINEVTGGVWPLFYSGRANPELNVNVCENTISGREGETSTGVGGAAQRTFTINGSINGDGSMTITWSYVRDVGATPASPAKGTFTAIPL
jgi:hypothetical protein